MEQTTFGISGQSYWNTFMNKFDNDREDLNISPDEYSYSLHATGRRTSIRMVRKHELQLKRVNALLHIQAEVQGDLKSCNIAQC